MLLVHDIKPMRQLDSQTLHQSAFFVSVERAGNDPLDDRFHIRLPNRLFYDRKQRIPRAMMIAAADPLSQPASEGICEFEIPGLVLECALKKSRHFRGVDSAREFPDDVSDHCNNSVQMLFVR